MAELRPLLAILGLLVVAGGLLVWIARMRGWSFEWWERFFSPGRRNGPEASAAARSLRRRAKRDERARPPSPAARSGGGDTDRAAGGEAPDRSGSGPARQTVIDLDFLPLLGPEGEVGGESLDRDYDVGDLGAIEAEAGGTTGPAPAAKPKPGRQPASKPPPKPGRPPAGEEPRARPARSARPARPTKPVRSARETPEPRGGGRELLVVLTIVTSDGSELSGQAIREAFTAFELHPDEHGMFHHYGNRRGSPREPVFSVANVLEPGVFDPAAMDELATPGLCLFMRRPGALPAAVAFDLMLDVGNRLSRTLGAVLCDDQRCRLTAQATLALRERVVHFALRHERAVPGAR